MSEMEKQWAAQQSKDTGKPVILNTKLLDALRDQIKKNKELREENERLKKQLSIRTPLKRPPRAGRWTAVEQARKGAEKKKKKKDKHGSNDFDELIQEIKERRGW